MPKIETAINILKSLSEVFEENNVPNTANVNRQRNRSVTVYAYHNYFGISLKDFQIIQIL